jgi:hypothetical protein
MESMMKYLFILMFIVTGLELSAENYKETLFIFKEKDCASCVMASVKSISESKVDDNPSIKIKFIYGTKDTVLVNKLKSIIDTGKVEVVWGAKAAPFIKYYCSESNATPLCVLVDSNRDFIRIPIYKDYDKMIKKPELDVFKLEGSDIMKEIGSYSVGKISSAKLYKNQIFAITRSDEFYRIDLSNSKAEKIAMLEDNKYDYFMKNPEDVDFLKILSKNGISTVKPKSFKLIDDSLVVMDALAIRKFEMDSTLDKEGRYSYTNQVFYGMVEAVYNYVDKKIRYSDFEDKLNSYYFTYDNLGEKGEKYIFTHYFFGTKSIAQLASESTYNPLSFSDKNYNPIDSVSALRIARIAGVDSIRESQIDYYSQARYDQGLIVSPINGIYILKNGGEYKNLNKSGTLQCAYLNEDDKDLLYPYFRIDGAGFPIINANSGVYDVFQASRSGKTRRIIMSRYDSKGEQMFQKTLFENSDGEELKAMKVISDSDRTILLVKYDADYKVYEIKR